MQFPIFFLSSWSKFNISPSALQQIWQAVKELVLFGEDFVKIGVIMFLGGGRRDTMLVLEVTSICLHYSPL